MGNPQEWRQGENSSVVGNGARTGSGKTSPASPRPNPTPLPYPIDTPILPWSFGDWAPNIPTLVPFPEEPPQLPLSPAALTFFFSVAASALASAGVSAPATLVDLQAQARAHRIGQKRDVLVLRFETVSTFPLFGLALGGQ
ncbi:hypothetical protein PIB30_074428 [Stylosanthes scabra]|uniref:Uncharacterized protein n=1 Tax=Stylosanthes scabra TaxID=79078 RepID=A0ABU6QQT8_9FABA|nr:hypothetical protein [Stylosanthes scabra]